MSSKSNKKWQVKVKSQMSTIIIEKVEIPRLLLDVVNIEQKLQTTGLMSDQINFE